MTNEEQAAETTDLIREDAKAEERANIVRYLRHVARVDIGSILSPASKEVVDWCASWVENELDRDRFTPVRMPVEGGGLAE